MSREHQYRRNAVRLESIPFLPRQQPDRLFVQILIIVSVLSVRLLAHTGVGINLAHTYFSLLRP